jgi:hypothetical protein
MDQLRPHRRGPVQACHQPLHAGQFGPRWVNGDTGIVVSTGAGAQFVRETYAEYPPAH